MEASKSQIPDIVISCSPSSPNLDDVSSCKVSIINTIELLKQKENILPHEQIGQQFAKLKNLVCHEVIDGQWLKEEDLIKKILTCIETHLAAADSLMTGLQTINFLLLNHTSLQSMIQDDSFVHMFLRILKTFEDDVILLEGLSIATTLTYTCHGLLRRELCTWNRHVQTLCVYLTEKFKDSLSVLTAIFNCLLTIHEIPTEDTCDQFIQEFRCHWLLDAMERHLGDRNLILLACKLLRRLVSESTIDVLVDDGAPAVVVRCFKKYYLQEDILLYALDILLCLMRRESTKCSIIQSKALEDLLSALMKFSPSTSTQAKGFQFFYHMVQKWSQSTRDTDEVEQWVKQIYWTMAHHREDISVQIACCNAVSVLLEFCPELKQLIGEVMIEGQVPIHTVAVGSLFMHDQNPDVFEAACNAIYWITADNPEIQEPMVEKNIFIVIQLGMRLLRGYVKALAAGCKALRGMCIFNEEYKERIAWHALKEVMRAFCSSSSDLLIHVESLATLACLADIELVRKKCMVEQIHERIVKYMIIHMNSQLFQEVALEALAILCAADDGPKLLNEIDALTRVVDAMSCHEDDEDIQKKCLILIQLLGDGQYLLDHLELSSHLASCVVDAMMKHRHSAGVQAEGCVAMQILAECCEQMGNHLVDAKAHECLFYILEEYNNYIEVQELAGECLFVLSEIRNLKSRMLQCACAMGLIRAVECLVQLGADVNCGTGQDTPLCYACKRKDRDMLLYLLNNGASNMNDALRLGLESENHQIVGLLLSRMGYDKSDCAISWSGLGLGDVHPNWFGPIFKPLPSNPATSEVGKMIAAKVKTTEVRRKTREMEGSKTRQADLTFSKLPLRYSFRGAKTCAPDLQDYLFKLQESQDLAIGKSDEQGDGASSIFGFIRQKLQQLKTQKDDEQNPHRRSRKPELIKTYSARLSESVQNAQDNTMGFSQTEEEMSEWKRTTLTGSNVPFHPLDPRRSSSRSTPSPPQSIPGEWQRQNPQNRKKSSSASDVTSESESPAVFPGKAPFTKQLILFKSSSTTTLDRVAESDSQSEVSIQSDRESIGTPTLQENNSGDTDDNIQRISLLRRRPVSSRIGAWSPGIDYQISYQRLAKRTVTMNDMMRLASDKCTLRQMDLSNNNISSLTKLVRTDLSLHFERIERLDLSMNNLQTFPEELFIMMPSLKHLNLQRNRLSKAPAKALAICRILKSLNLSNNEITEIGDMAYQASGSLVELNLSHNSLRTLPLWFSKTLPKLQTLKMAGNKIETLPPGPVKLKKLVLLDLSYNYLKTIPDNFLQLCHSLETLRLEGNELENLPSEETSKCLGRLSELKLKNNMLGQKGPPFLPKFILELSCLTSVDIGNNQIKELPAPMLWKSQQIKQLKVARNQITHLNLGDQAKQWISLERLDISRNKLTELPKGLGQLVNLISLDFSYNDITTIPDELGRLTHLYELPLGGLKLDLDEALLKGRVKDLIGYLHEKLKRAVEYYHMKMMLVGFGGRGKTTLLRALMKQKQPQKSLPTVGVFVKDWRFSGRNNKKLVTYTLSTWDFAGQEDFYCTHQCFMSNRALYLVVYNISNGDSEIDNLGPWLRNIQARAPNCPVVIVGTHLDLVPRHDRDGLVMRMRDLIKELCEKPGFPCVRAVTEVDCSRENAGIEKLRVLIKEVLDGFQLKGRPVMGQKIPASYVKLQDLLSAESYHLSAGLPIIRHSRLLKIVKDAELDLDQDELKHAVRFLHEAGVLLHYEDATLQLNDLYFINPGWLCRMMAQVVTVREINPFINSAGIMLKEDVPLLFTGKKIGEDAVYSFPPSLIPQYLRLLERFEIVLPRSDNELLIPSRLPKKKPLIIMPATSKNGKIIREYCMEYVPSGFWSRLICRLLVFHSKFLNEQLHTEPLDITFWRQGIYVCYNQNSFFLLESLPNGMTHTGIMLTVPASKMGARLIGEVVDHIDSLIDEWYPGLNELCPDGKLLVRRVVPCQTCANNKEISEAHLFDLDELISLSDLEDTIFCPGHSGRVLIAHLAPDVVLGDLDDKYILDNDQFVFVKRQENLLGDGSYGRVYRGRYKGQTVAVKEYLTIGELHPHVLMRREVAILQRLDHPNLVSLFGVGLRPRVLVLELAPHGALGPLVRAGKVHNRFQQHKIAFQVAEGLHYIHSQKIVYRDLKMDNILVFNINTASSVTVKISDYGISRLVAPYGLAQSEGTPGYRAPEVIRGEAYGVQADVYSYGMMFYELLTKGTHPFQDFNFRSQFDDAALSGKPIEAITSKGATPWPDVEELISQCLSAVPEHRPKTTDIIERLDSIDLLALKNAVLVSKDDSLTYMSVSSNHGDTMEVWMTSFSNEHVQVSWARLSSSKSAVKGKLINDSRVLSIVSVIPNSVLCGTESGRIWVFNSTTHAQKHTMDVLPDSVLCLQQFSCAISGNDFILAGLADGRLAVFETKQLLMSSHAPVRFIQLGSSLEPVKCMVLHNPTKRLLIGVGPKVVQIGFENGPEVLCSWHTNNRGGRPGLVSHVILHNQMLHLSKKGQSLLEMWHAIKHKLRHTFNAHEFLVNHDQNSGLQAFDARVTAIALVQTSLWVGTATGHVILLDVINYQPITVFRRYQEAIRCILWARHLDQVSTVLLGGMGFISKENQTSLGNYGVLSEWDADISGIVTSQREDRRRREQQKRRCNSIEFN